MEGRKQFAVVGSDARQAAAARALARAGYRVGGPEKIAVADYILLPLPLDAARTPLAELLRAARPGTLALGGSDMSLFSVVEHNDDRYTGSAQENAYAEASD